MVSSHHIVQDAHGAHLWSGFVLVHDGVLPLILARHHGHQFLPWTADILPHLRGCHHVKACCLARIPRAAWHTDEASTLISSQPQHAGGARAGMQDRHSPRPAWPGSSVQGDSYRGVWSETIPQLGDVSPDASVRPLPAMMAGSCSGRGPMGAPDSGDNASLRGGAPPCTAGPINDGSQSRPESPGHPHLPCLALDLSLHAPAAPSSSSPTCRWFHR